MKKNVGKTDRIIRLVIGAAVIIAALVYQSWLLAILGVVALGTGLVGFCGLYKVFGISTCPIDVSGEAKCELEDKKQPTTPTEMPKQ